MKKIVTLTLLFAFQLVIYSQTHALSNASDSFLVSTKADGTVSVWDKLMKGVNQDASIPTSANFEKAIHEVGHMQTISEAGFESVRFFIAYNSSNFTGQQQRIQDALDNNLAVIICMWGPNNWYNNNQAESKIAERWTAIAQWVETNWPGEDDIVFELLNETGAINFPQTNDGHLLSMKLYGAAANAVRAVSATRKILISPPGWQDADKMSYVTQENMGYDFANDTNVGISIHFYEPNSDPIGWFAMNEYPLNNPLSNDWKQPIIDEVAHVLTWRAKNNVPNMPIVVTEWGVWSFPAREASGDLALTVEYQAQYFRDHNIGSTWYTGIQYNQRAFAIFDTETGWNNTVSQAITQQPAPTTWPAMNQFVGSEFEDYSSKTWKRTDGQPHAQSDRVQFANALSGNTSLKLTAPVTIYQRSFVGLVDAYVEVAENMETRLGKYLLHLIEGRTYKVSFKAKAVDGSGTMKFSMKENQSSASGSTVINQTGTTYHTSNPITITSSANTYSFTYTHNQATAWDVWFEFEVVSGTVIIDAVDFRQNSPVNGTLTNATH